MNNEQMTIDLTKLFKYCIKRIWLPVLLGVFGFILMYYNTAYRQTDMYSASATMYIYNGNPNVVNYQYTNQTDLNSAVQLLDTYMVVVKSDRVMDVVAERLCGAYPGISPDYIKDTISMGSVSKTGVMRIVCETENPDLSADICNAVLDVAPAEIIRIVSAGSIQIIDYAQPPTHPVSRNPLKSGLMGGMAGCVVAAGLLLLFFMLNSVVTEAKDLEESFTLPILARVRREKTDGTPSEFLMDNNSKFEKLESYATLRMNLQYSMIGKDSRVIEVTSAISGEGKSTIAANLAVSCAMGKKRVLLIDADLRRACQNEIFKISGARNGLSEVLLGSCELSDAVITDVHPGLDILVSGKLPPDPAEMLSSRNMKALLDRVNSEYDLVILDVPPINVVSDPLVLSDTAAGCLFVVRQNYSDQREIKHAIAASKLTGMHVMGFVFYGEKLHRSPRYYKKYYKSAERSITS